MATNFISLPAELRLVVYHEYERAYNFNAHRPTIIGERILLPPLVYADHRVDDDVGDAMFNRLAARFLKAKTIRAVVVNLDFAPLLEFLESLSEKAPLVSGHGKLELKLVFTQDCLGMPLAIAKERKRSLWSFCDFLGELAIYYEGDRDIAVTRAFRFDPPEVEDEFEKSPLLDAMGGCRFERADLAARRISKARAEASRMVEGMAHGTGSGAKSRSLKDIRPSPEKHYGRQQLVASAGRSKDPLEPIEPINLI